nr:hypothetical protein [Providencia vermicola]
MKIYRLLWNEDELFSPQQFQQQVQLEAFTNQGASGLSSLFTWGKSWTGWITFIIRLLASLPITGMVAKLTMPFHLSLI